MFKFFSARSKWTATRFRPATITTPPRRTWSSASARDPKEFFLTRDMTRQKFAKIQEWGKAFTIFGTPVYQEFLAGKRELTCTAWAIPTYNVKGWKAPCYLMTDGHYGGYQEMLDEGGLGKIRRGGRRRARPALRTLHGPLRLRPQRRARHQLSARRQLEEFQIQLRRQAQAVSSLAGTGEARLQRRDHRQRPSGRGQGRHQFSRRRRARCVFRTKTITSRTSAAIAARATRPSAMSCWRRSKT